MRSLIFSLAGLMLFASWLVPSSVAWSQNTGDRGQWQVLEARYGSAQRSVDVTRRVQELARTDRTFTVTNEVLGGDPHPNVPKTLRIRARTLFGATQTFEYAENRVVQATQFIGGGAANVGQAGGVVQGDGGQWQILEARYGSAQQSMDVTQRVRDLAGSGAQFIVSNDLFGRDPHPNVVKSLRISVRGPDGQTRSFEYAENQFVNRSQFTGWNAGNSGGGSGGRDSGADSGW